MEAAGLLVAKPDRAEDEQVQRLSVALLRVFATGLLSNSFKNRPAWPRLDYVWERRKRHFRTGPYSTSDAGKL